MNREIHVRFCESLRVKLPRATRLGGWGREAPAYPINPAASCNFRCTIDSSCFPITEVNAVIVP